MLLSLSDSPLLKEALGPVVYICLMAGMGRMCSDWLNGEQSFSQHDPNWLLLGLSHSFSHKIRGR